MNPEIVRARSAAGDALASEAALLDDLFGAYAAALDFQDWAAWLQLFTEDCSYAVYSLDNVQAGLPLGYMIDDSRNRLKDRVRFMTDVWAGTIEPYRTRHMIQRISIERVGASDLYKARANMLVSYTEPDRAAAILVSGYYEDIVRVTEAGPRFVSKTVYLDGTPARYLAYPL